MSVADGLAGNVQSQLGALENITMNQEVHDCLPPGLLANTLKEKGVALVTLALTQEDKEQKQVCTGPPPQKQVCTGPPPPGQHHSHLTYFPFWAGWSQAGTCHL